MANYVIVSTDISDKVIKAGPLVWDGTTHLTLPTGTQTMLVADAIAGGYTFPAPPVTQQNAASMQAQALAAISANVTYLGLASPTNAQVAAQVNRLTRECSALIRLLLGATDDTSGT